MGQVWGIVVAAGSGRRFGGPKQFELLQGRRVLDWSLATAQAACDYALVVLPADRLEPGSIAGGATANRDAAAGGAAAAGAVAGGATRSASVRAGLAAVPDEAEIVVVHDAARPLASKDLFARVIAAVRDGADAAIPGVPVTDTVKQVSGSVVVATVDRSALVAVQTPQAFRAASLRQAHASAPEASDDAALIEAAGGVVVVVLGEARNLKITSPDDLLVAGMWLDPHRDRS